jgi:hypothetical protein
VFTTAWGDAAARTWNRHRSTLRSLTTWTAARWSMTDLAALVERRRENTDATKVIDRHLIETLWQRRDLPLRDKALFRLLYESAAALRARDDDPDPPWRTTQNWSARLKSRVKRTTLALRGRFPLG